MNGLFILLGSNLGDRLTNLQKAKNLLIENGFKLIDQSSVYETEPWGISEQPWFLNAVVHFNFADKADHALSICLSVEMEMGRKRIQKWGERLIDIDILFFNDEIIDAENLKIPHPGIPDRRFALLPLAEKWDNKVHPILQKTMTDLLEQTTDGLSCTKTNLTL